MDPAITLDAQHDELVRLGFEIVDRRSDSLVATRLIRHMDLFALKHYCVVYVRHLEELTNEILEADRVRLSEFAKKLAPSILKRGLGAGTGVLPIYVADRVEPAARAACTAKPKPFRDWTYLPSVLDRSTGEATYLRETAKLGAMTQGKIRHIVRRLIDPEGTNEKAPLSWWGIGLLTVIIVAAILQQLS